MERTAPAAVSTAKLIAVIMATWVVHTLIETATGLRYSPLADPFDLSNFLLDLTLWFVPFACFGWPTIRLTNSSSR